MRSYSDSKLVCCVCTGIHHPDSCPEAQRLLVQCRLPMPEPVEARRLSRTEAIQLLYDACLEQDVVVDLENHRRQRARRHNDARQSAGTGGAISGIRLG